jgi:succinoglycan biosynthesis transport protein ExoP
MTLHLGPNPLSDSGDKGLITSQHAATGTPIFPVLDKTPVDRRELPEADTIPRYLLGVLWRRRSTIRAIALAVVTLTAIYLLMMPPLYQAQSLLIVDPHAARASGAPDAARDTSFIQSQIELMRSPLLIERVLEQEARDDDATSSPRAADLPRQETTPLTPRMKAKIDAFLENLTVARRDPSYLIELKYIDADPAVAARRANAMANAYLEMSQKTAAAVSSAAVREVEARAAEAHEAATKAQRELRRFKADHNIAGGDVPAATAEQEKPAIDRSTRTSAVLASLFAAEARLQQGESYVDQPLYAFGRDLHSAQLSDLRRRFVELKRKELELSDSSPDRPHEIQAVLADMDRLSREIEDEISRLLDEQDDKVSSRLAELERQEKAALDFVAAAQAKLKDASLADNASAIEQVRVISAAEPPPAATGPRKLVLLSLAGALGLALGLGAALLGEALRDDIKTLDDIKRVLGIRSATLVPAVDFSTHNDAADKASENGGGFQIGAPADDFAANGVEHEQEHAKAPDQRIRKLVESLVALSKRLARLYLKTLSEADPGMAPGDPAVRRLDYLDAMLALKQAADRATAPFRSRVVTVLSAAEGEGKSMTAVNLAAVAAASGERTLLIDANMRDPGLTEELLSEESFSLADAVKDGYGLDQVAVPIGAGFDFCSAPKSRQSQIVATFGSPRLAALLADARKRYAMIIVDTPGILEFPDAQSLLAETDLAILVIDSRSTSRGAARAALSKILAAGNRNVEVILNRCAAGGPDADRRPRGKVDSGSKSEDQQAGAGG